jgi:hypothetical protein
MTKRRFEKKKNFRQGITDGFGRQLEIHSFQLT